MNYLTKIIFIITIQYILKTDNYVLPKKNSKPSLNKIRSTETTVSTSTENILIDYDTAEKETATTGFDEKDYNSYPQYKFEYEVSDPTTGDYKKHEETRDGDIVQGEYSLMEPDGKRRIVRYISNGTSGFNAVVSKQIPNQINSTNHISLSQITDNKETVQSNTTYEYKDLGYVNSKIENHSDEPILWYSTKTEYFPADILQQSPIDPESIDEKSEIYDTSSDVSNNLPNHSITYSLNILNNISNKTLLENQTSDPITKTEHKNIKNKKNINVQIINETHNDNRRSRRVKKQTKKLIARKQ